MIGIIEPAGSISSEAIDRAMAAYERAQSYILGGGEGDRWTIRDYEHEENQMLWSCPKNSPDSYHAMEVERDRLRWQRALEAAAPIAWPAGAKFNLGNHVRKHSGSWWEGVVVGFYSTEQTPTGYAVQLDTATNGPVQIYPEQALEAAFDGGEDG